MEETEFREVGSNDIMQGLVSHNREFGFISAMGSCLKF